MRIIAVLIVALSFAVPAQAQTYEDAKACVGDAFRFCKHAVPHGMTAIKECLISNNSRLGNPCRKALKNHGA